MLLGRGDVLQQVTAALDAGRSVVLAGPPGVGRTALLQRLAATIEGARATAGLATVAGRALVPLAWLVRDHPPQDSSDVATWVRGRLPQEPLLCDDLDEADAATADAFVELARRTVPVVVTITRGRSRPSGEGRLEEFEAAGAVVIDVHPLGPEDASGLARALGAADPDRMAVASGGFPAAIAAVVQGRPVPAAVDAEWAAVVGGLSPAARHDLALLAVIGRPLQAELAGGPELASAGVARSSGEGWEVRCGAAAERTLSSFDAGARASLHLAAAELVLDDPVSVVGHLRAGGDTAGAAAHAERAAQGGHDPATEAQLWSLLAAETGLPSHHLSAAGAAVRAADGDVAASEAAAAVATARSLAPADAAAGRLALAQAARLQGDEVRALDVLSDAPADHESSVVERARLLALTSWRVPETALLAPSPTTALLISLAATIGGTPGGFDEAVGAAAARADREVELTAIGAAALAAAAVGDGDRARIWTATLERRVRETAVPSWSQAPSLVAAVLTLHLDGDPRAALEVIEADGTHSAPVAANGAYALAQVGRVGEAAALLERTRWPATPVGQGLRWWSSAEVAEMAGRRTTCVAAAERCLEVSPEGFPLVALARLAAARAAAEAGDAVAPWEPMRGWWSDAVVAEVRALGQPGRGKAAADAHQAAAEAWAGRHEPSHLRCRWAAADARIALDARVAVAELEGLEAVAVALELHPLLARIRRSLRAAGVRRTAPAAERGGTLSTREREVLLLVREGLASPEIAARLGVARSTIETQVKSAIRKLGAKTRVHAASLLDVSQ